MRQKIAAGLVALSIASTPLAAQAQAPTPPANDQMPMKHMMMDKRHASGMPMHKSGHHRMDTIADKLNACQLKPQAERQLCIDRAVSP
jgi:hypothetical protein